MPTSITGTNSAGYTLLEVLVVLVILAGIGIAIPVASGAFSSANQLRTAAMQVHADLVALRADAIRNGRQTSLTVDTGGLSYRMMPAGTQRALPSDMSIALAPVDFAPARPTSGDILFYPDGIAEGAHITLVLGAMERHLNVSWPAGTVREDLE